MKKLFVSMCLGSLMLVQSAWAAPTITTTITPGTNATSHRIEKKIGAGAWATLTVLTMPTVSYTDTAVSIGNIYYYRVVAINTFGASAPSIECNQALVVPGPPTLSCTVNP